MSDKTKTDQTEHHGEELFSAKVKAGTRTYFIDVRRSATGTCPKDAVGDS